MTKGLLALARRWWHCKWHIAMLCIFLGSLDESLLGQRTMLQVANNLFDSYMGACEKSDNAEPLLVVTVCQKNVASLTKYLQYCTWTRENKTSSELGLNKQPITAVERFPKKWQNQTIVMLLDNGRRRNRNRSPPLELMNIFGCYNDAKHRKGTQICV